MILTWGSAPPSRKRSVRAWRSWESCREAQARRGCGGTRVDAGVTGTGSLHTPDSEGAVAEGWSASASPLHRYSLVESAPASGDNQTS